MKLIVTGFGPFPGVPVNPAATVAEKTVAQLKSKGIYATFEQLDVSIQTCREFYDKIKGKDIFVLHIGVYTELLRPEIETVGRNILNFGCPDVKGEKPVNKKIDDSVMLREKIPNPVDFRSIIPESIGFGYSTDAGEYICNCIYFLALENIKKKINGAVFVHIPSFEKYPENKCVENMTKFAEAIVEHCNAFGIKK